MQNNYPKRDSHHAHRVVRKMLKSCAAQEIGTDGVLLVTAIAHTEDAKRYSGPVTYFNGQLQPILGMHKWDRLDRARKAAIKAGWLHYEPSGNRSPGIYWTLIPNHAMGLDDSPTDEGLPPETSPSGGTIQNANESNIPCGGDKAGMNQGIKRGRTGGQSGDEVGEPSTLSLSPVPVPNQVSTVNRINNHITKGCDSPIVVDPVDQKDFGFAIQVAEDILKRVSVSKPAEFRFIDRVAVLVARGQISQGEAMDAAEGVRIKDPKHPSAYFRTSLVNLLKRRNVNLQSLLDRTQPLERPPPLDE